jgi:signal transduction histidine kinase
MREFAIDAEPSASAAPSDGSPSETEALRRRLIRLAFDVHDGPMQSLTAIGYGMHELHRQLDSHPPAIENREAVAAQLSAMMAELAAAEAGLRGLISLLEHGKPEIETVDVIAAAELTRFKRHCNAVTELIVEPPSFQPDTHSQAIVIGSVLREALNNIAKHAGASKVLVRLQASSTGMLLEITDDGIGFDPSGIRPGSMGLAGMRERVNLLDGSFDILSKPGGPTVVTVLLGRWHGPSDHPTGELPS